MSKTKQSHIVKDLQSPEVTACLQHGGIVVALTDTIYGILAQAKSQAAVARVYNVKERTPTKSPIVLIHSIDDLFDSYNEAIQQKLQTYWPGKNSIILESHHAPNWISRKNASVAYRLPDNASLRNLIKITGPLIAPSANPEGQPPAMTIDEAIAYFGNTVDLYVDGGNVTDNTPSNLFRINPDGSTTALR